MRKYFEIEDELLEAKADEKPVTFFVVYRTWNEKNFNHIPSDGLVMSIIPTSYKTVKLAIKNKEKFAAVPFIANSLDKIEIYEVLDDMTMGDYKSLKHYERESLLTKCKLVYEEDLRNKNEEYERGYRAGRREALRKMDEEEHRKGIFQESLNQIRFSNKEDVEKLLKQAGRLNGLCYVSEKNGDILLNYSNHNESSMSVTFVINLSEGEVDFDRYKVDKGLKFFEAEDLQYQIRDLADLLKDTEEDLGKLVKAKIIKL